MLLEDVHGHCLAKAATLSGFAMAHAIGPLEVVAVLNASGVKFMLIGAYGLTGWIKRPRATEDVDVLVMTRHHKKAVKGLLTEFPHLETRDLDVVTRLCDRETKEVAIDVVKPVEPLFQVGLKHTQEVTAEGQTYRIPTLEMALSMKFAPMISPNREDGKKYMDAHDFFYMVRNHPEIDLDKLAELGDLVYNGGGKEVLDMVRRVRAGEKLIL